MTISRGMMIKFGTIVYIFVKNEQLIIHFAIIQKLINNNNNNKETNHMSRGSNLRPRVLPTELAGILEFITAFIIFKPVKV